MQSGGGGARDRISVSSGQIDRLVSALAEQFRLLYEVSPTDPVQRSASSSLRPNITEWRRSGRKAKSRLFSTKCLEERPRDCRPGQSRPWAGLAGESESGAGEDGVQEAWSGGREVQDHQDRCRQVCRQALGQALQSLDAPADAPITIRSRWTVDAGLVVA